MCTPCTSAGGSQQCEARTITSQQSDAHTLHIRRRSQQREIYTATSQQPDAHTLNIRGKESAPQNIFCYESAIFQAHPALLQEGVSTAKHTPFRVSNLLRSP